MIRQPLRTALVGARTRPDIHRVTDGIAASLRQFSTAQRLCAGPGDKNNSGDGNDPNASRRQRAVAAVDELIAMTESTVDQLQHNQPPGQEEQQQQQQDQQQLPSSPLSRQAPNIIKVDRLPIRGGLTGFRKVIMPSGDNSRGGSHDANPNIIRGGFRPRGRGGFGLGAQNGGGRTSGGRIGGGRGDGRGGRGRGRGGRGGRGGREGRRGGRGRDAEEGEDGKDAEDDPDYITPEEREFFAEQAEGTVQPFNPTVTLDSLVGYSPAVPAAGPAPLARRATVVRQARILGGAHPYSEDDFPVPQDAHAALCRGNGAFFPTPEAREWAMRCGSSGLRARLEANAAASHPKKSSSEALSASDEASASEPPPPPIPDPLETTKQAVLEDALLGKYNGPQYADPADTLGTARNYVRRDGSWRAASERMLLAKIESLLPSTRAKAGGAGENKARANA